jgi:hypothetical protein
MLVAARKTKETNLLSRPMHIFHVTKTLKYESYVPYCPCNEEKQYATEKLRTKKAPMAGAELCPNQKVCRKDELVPLKRNEPGSAQKAKPECPE